MDMELETNLFPEAPTPKAKPAAPTERVRIVLDENENIPPGGLYLGLNGYGYRIAPGVEVNVPVGVVDILDHAIETVTILDPITKQKIGTREKRRYSYSLVK